MLTMYFGGWLITTIGALAASDRLSGADSPPTRVLLGVGVLAGALWPLVIMGLVQAAAIAIIVRPWRAPAVRRSNWASSIQLKEVLAVSSD